MSSSYSIEQYLKAVPQLERASTISFHIFGETDPFSLSLVEATADALVHQGNFPQACKKIETLVGLYQKKYDYSLPLAHHDRQDDLSVLRMMENLIFCYQRRAAFPFAVESSVKMTKMIDETKLEKPIQER